MIFITIEDETGIANLVVWSSLFDRQRRIVLSASMLACHGRVQREGDVIHVVAEQLDDLSDLLRSVGHRAAGVPGAAWSRRCASRIRMGLIRARWAVVQQSARKLRGQRASRRSRVETEKLQVASA